MYKLCPYHEKECPWKEKSVDMAVEICHKAELDGIGMCEIADGTFINVESLDTGRKWIWM